MGLFLENETVFVYYFFLKFFIQNFFLVVLTPADLWYHAWFPRYRHLTLFVTEQEQEEEEQELGILGV